MRKEADIMWVLFKILALFVFFCGVLVVVSIVLSHPEVVTDHKSLEDVIVNVYGGK